MNDPDFTLSAGPVTASARTLAALGSPITYHYDPAFLDCFRRTERKVAQLLQTAADVVLMQGEAVLGLEAAARANIEAYAATCGRAFPSPAIEALLAALTRLECNPEE